MAKKKPKQEKPANKYGIEEFMNTSTAMEMTGAMPIVPSSEAELSSYQSLTGKMFVPTDTNMAE